MIKMKYILTGMLSGRVIGRLTGDEYGGSGKLCCLPEFKVDYQLWQVYLYLRIYMTKFKYILTGMLSGKVPGRLTGEEYGGSGKLCCLTGWMLMAMLSSSSLWYSSPLSSEQLISSYFNLKNNNYQIIKENSLIYFVIFDRQPNSEYKSNQDQLSSICETLFYKL